jgi:nitrogenase molybdenum-iron protein alpha/beta subunit
LKQKYFWTPRQFLSVYAKFTSFSLDDLEEKMIEERGIKIDRTLDTLFFFKLKAMVYGIKLKLSLTTSRCNEITLDLRVNKW